MDRQALLNIIQAYRKENDELKHRLKLKEEHIDFLKEWVEKESESKIEWAKVVTEIKKGSV